MDWLIAFAGNLARQLVRRLVRLYYPRIEVTGRERIPATGPVLLAANHPNSLMDPVILGIAAQRPIHFLAKAPLFDVPILGRMLRTVGMLPAYRASDDASQLKRNLESLSAGAAYLVEGKVIGIFPEGKSHDLPKVEQVRTGAARIAVQAVQDGAKALKIVPLGLNYEQKERFRSTIWVRVGEPIDMEAWIQDQADDQRKGMRALTAEIDRRLKETVVHLNEEKWEPFLNDLEILLPPPKESAKNPLAILRQRKRIADAMNHFLATDRPRAETMAAEIERHREKLRSAGLDTHAAILRLRGWKLGLRIAWEALWILLGFFLVLAGTLHHLPPFFLTRLVACRIQAPGRSTIALSRLGLGLPFYAAWYGFTWWWMSKYFLPWVAWVWLTPMPLAGIMALQYWSHVGSKGRSWWRELKILLRRDSLNELRQGQQRLHDHLGIFANDYARARPVEPLPLNLFSWRRFGLGTVRWTSLSLIMAVVVIWGASWFKQRTMPDLNHPGPDLDRIPLETLAANLDADEKTLDEMIGGLRELEAKAALTQAEFASGQRSFYRQQDDDAIRQLLLSYLTFRTTLLGLLWKYQDHTRVADERVRLRAFLADYAAAAVLYDASLKLVTRFQHSPETVRKLNEPEPLWSIPPGIYEMIRQNLLQPRTRELLAEAHRNYHSLQDAFVRHGLMSAPPYARFHEAIGRCSENNGEMTKLLVEAKLGDPLKEVAKVGKEAGYRAQSFISTWLGGTKIRQPRQGRAMIQPDQLAKLRSDLRPGDILLERQNWYLSRAFMPGYWAHAAIYVGTTNDLIRLGLDRDPRVRRHWQAFAARDREGHEQVILEAVPDGVRITTLEHCIGVADSAAVLRPRLKTEATREAIARAFSHLGKPYDFEFDFFSTDKLVCTELVFRAYDGEINFQLVEVLGRKTLPPTELVRKFVSERGKPNAQLECVCFLDCDEAGGKARFRNEEIFAETLRRPSLSWLQDSVSQMETIAIPKTRP